MAKIILGNLILGLIKQFLISVDKSAKVLIYS